MNAQDSKAEVFDIFLCHNTEDKPAVREIAQELSKENIKPWLDEADIIGGSFWHTAIGQQIETVKAAAVFLGQHGVGPWQRREIIALLYQFDKRGCPIIPVILASAPLNVVLPWSLLGHHCVDFRAKDSYPLKRLVWAVTGEKPKDLSAIPSWEKPAIMVSAAEAQLLPGKRCGTEPSKAHFGEDVGKSRLYPPLAKPPDEEQAGQLEILRSRVTEYWIDGVLNHSLYNEALISLGSRQVDQFVDAPWKYTIQTSDAISSAPLADRDVSAIYDATGLLLILGEPGSGKTTTLLELAQTLLRRARDDFRERVPIVLNLSNWKKKQSLAEWMSGELSEKYRVPRKIASFWLKKNYLLPLLDGLDEVQTSMQPDCVAAINTYIEESNPSGLVVCCRLTDYRWLPKRLKFNGAICLESISSEEVSKYLDRGGSNLAALRESVATDPVLQELAQTPLMLSIMSLAFQGVGGNELASQKGASLEERRKQIFRLYVDQMFQRKGTASIVFQKKKTIDWLSWLAKKMREDSQSDFFIEGLEPSWLDTRSKHVAYRPLAALSLGLILGLIFGLNCCVIGWQTGGLRGVLGYGLGTGLIMGLFVGLFSLVGVGLGCWSEWPKVNGVICGSIVGVMGWLSGEQLHRLTAVLSLGLIAGLFGGLGVGTLNHIELVETINWNWKQFWKNAIPGLIAGLIVGVIGPVADGLIEFESLYTGDDRDNAMFAIADATAQILPTIVTLGPMCGLVTGFAGGFTNTVKVGKAAPNQGIELSLKNSFIVFLVSSLAVWLMVELINKLDFWLPDEEFIWLTVGLIVGLNRGGSAVIKHRVLRLILWLRGYTPFNFVKFLNHCTKLIFLKKVGGGYIFIHRMLLEYFAEMSPQSKKS